MIMQPLDFWPMPCLDDFGWILDNCSLEVEDVKDVPLRLACSLSAQLHSAQQKIAEYRYSTRAEFPYNINLLFC
jgi:hypothetical protein